MEENKNEEGVVSESQNAPLDNNQEPNTPATEAEPTNDKPAEAPIAQQPAVENIVTENIQPAATEQPENKSVEAVVVKKGGVLGKVIFIIIIILAVFLLVKFFGDKEAGLNVLDTISNVNVKVSDEQEQGKVNIVAEDNRQLNDKVSEQAADQPQLATTSASRSATASTIKIIAFYPNSVKNPGSLDCSKVFALERNAENKYDSDIINTIRGLLTALTTKEKSQGFTTNIPSGTMLKTVKINDNGVAEVNFTATLNKIGGSCAVSAARAQIERTVKQFPGVKSVLICVDGNCKQDEILQP